MKPLNPFSTCFTAPGQIEFIETQVSVQQLAEKIGSDQHNFQILGPHGCGKTTLTIALANQLALMGLNSRWVTLRRSNRFSLPTARLENYPVGSEAHSGRNREVIFLDGIECLTLIQRSVMLRSYEKSQRQFIITTHRKLMGLPVLVTLRPNPKLFQRLVAKLYSETNDEWQSFVEESYAEAGGDIREALFLLYDRWEQDETSRPNA